MQSWLLSFFFSGGLVTQAMAMDFCSTERKAVIEQISEHEGFSIFSKAYCDSENLLLKWWFTQTHKQEQGRLINLLQGADGDLRLLVLMNSGVAVTLKSSEIDWTKTRTVSIEKKPSPWDDTLKAAFRKNQNVRITISSKLNLLNKKEFYAVDGLELNAAGQLVVFLHRPPISIPIISHDITSLEVKDTDKLVAKKELIRTLARARVEENFEKFPIPNQSRSHARIDTLKVSREGSMLWFSSISKLHSNIQQQSFKVKKMR